MQPGTRLGPYEIVSRIGAGGMGEVWRARDTRLDRDVAIKILPAEFAEDATLKIRFEREAKIISHLTPPNICALFDVGDNYIVMELIEGEPLAKRLQRGPMPLADVVRYGAQIAEALEKGHKGGVVHRDVKPGNIMITKSGAKLLDFGLARSTAIPRESTPEQSTFHQEFVTTGGVILGTPQYMAPEQLGGEELDARADIFALGAVLYEMATGKRAFEGSSTASLIAAIVGSQPQPIRELQPLTPPALEHVIFKCLEKDPEDRWQNASDIAEELRWISQAGSQSSETSLAVPRSRLRERLLWMAALVVATGLTAGGMLLFARRSAINEESIEASISMDVTGGRGIYSGPPAVSPDGRSIAFSAADKSGRTMLWVRSLSDSSPRPLPNTEGAGSPFWSPDGRFIAFTASGLKKIPAGGGNTLLIAASGGSGTWSRGGVILIGGGSLRQVPASGGEATELFEPKSIGATVLGAPSFLSDGKYFLFTARGDALALKNQDGVWIASLDRREKPRFVVHSSSANVAYIAPGWILYAHDGWLRAQRFDLKSLRVKEEAISLARVQIDVNSRALFSVSDSGVLVYAPPGTNMPSELRLRNRNGEIIRTCARGDYYTLRVSPDGRKIAVDRTEEQTSGDIWGIGLEDGSTSRLTFESLNETSPVWSPDGSAIAYQVGAKSSESGIAVKHLGGTTELLAKLTGIMLAPLDWSRDGRFLLAYASGRPGKRSDLVGLSLQTRVIFDVAATDANESAGVFSPDSKWIAYQSDESGRSEIYVQPFPVTGAKYQVSTAGGHWPRWRLPGEITYVDEMDHLSSVHVTATKVFKSDPPQTLPVIIDSHTGSRFAYYDLMPDGNIVENAVVRDNPPPLTLVTNWTRRLETAAKK